MQSITATAILHYSSTRFCSTKPLHVVINSTNMELHKAESSGPLHSLAL